MTSVRKTSRIIRPA
ncbi:MAG: hypothetical protein K9G59_08245 [Caulobacter sp.]|nr:hypothetical protein [Phenylobacterium sp.]MCF8504890.1 hypothetical protein [Caulobacter sp.]MDP3854736.1 hypothetical protein [Phenylobacterium sp.]